ncbi:protein sneaky-like isoform X1 [Macrosteles quadrilineatus]|uniref:protein sneaky-like isoform X1 n=1 Tax=Macrosteles quadrilineatus TaxID=74068 RepID=UPI0023E0A1AB|nr:protein sneaky-like isoform X1 [Macrosteles quadrilineatus]
MNRVIFGEQNECLIYRMLIGSVFGLTVGLAFYEFIISGIAFQPSTVFTLGVVFTMLLTLGCSLSSQIRCITLLTMPSFFGKSGRHIVKALVISALMSGPVPNIMVNVEELMRMFTCSNSMAHNLSQARYDLLVKPFKIAFLNTKVESEELKDMMGFVNNVVEPFAQEIEGVDDVKFIQEENDYMDEALNDTKRSEELENKYSNNLSRNMFDIIKNVNKSTSFKEYELNNTVTAEEYQKQYLKKLETRCENVKTGMGKACKKRFSNFKDKCEEALHWAISWAICWPMKLDVICDIVKMFTYGGYDCDPSSVVSSCIGKGYIDLRNAPDKLQNKVIEERIQYKLIKPPNIVGLHSVVSITKEFIHEIYLKKTLADAFLTITRTFLAFLFIMVIFSAQTYHNNYLRFTDYDNIYITADYRVLDARRRKHSKSTLLPQTKVERRLTADPYSLSLSKAEKSGLNKEFWLICALILVCSIVLGIDFALSEALDWIKNNLEFSYSEQGQHKFKIDVEGIGFVASLVRSIIQSFNFNKELKGEVSNRACLPVAKHLGMKAYIKLYGTCIFLCLLTYSEGYLKRLRRAICAFYYREQEKKRIETLYRRNIYDRRKMLKGQIEEIFKRVKNNETMYNERCLYRICTSVPQPWNFPLRVFSSARPVCVICEENEPFLVFWKPKHHKCTKCDSYCCVECWVNFGNSCFNCSATEKIDSDQALRHSVTYS